MLPPQASIWVIVVVGVMIVETATAITGTETGTVITAAVTVTGTEIATITVAIGIGVIAAARLPQKVEDILQSTGDAAATPGARLPAAAVLPVARIAMEGTTTHLLPPPPPLPPLQMPVVGERCRRFPLSSASSDRRQVYIGLEWYGYVTPRSVGPLICLSFLDLCIPFFASLLYFALI